MFVHHNNLMAKIMSSKRGLNFFTTDLEFEEQKERVKKESQKLMSRLGLAAKYGDEEKKLLGVNFGPDDLRGKCKIHIK